MFLKKYIHALSVIAISFATYPYIMVINVLYLNLYKVRKIEKRYLTVLLFMLIISTSYNFIAVYLFKDVIWIAIATTLSFITWYFYSMKDFSYIKKL